MTTAIIYARFSSDNQRDTSIEDQVRVCQRRIEHEGWTFAGVHSDYQISGAVEVANRPGGAALLADMMARKFDVLVIESQDRLSRNTADCIRTMQRLEYYGVRIVALSDGYDSRSGSHSSRTLQRGVRGLLNEIYLDDLRHKTHRGLSGQVSRGFTAGGLSYGYDLVKTEQGSRLVVNDQAAGWVRWIFEHYADGWSCQKIAHALNELGVKSPRDSAWLVSALYGSPNKGSGILNNELYIGRYIWNRSQWVKDPDTGKRKRVDRPRHEWVVEDRPELRIVSDDLWHRVRNRIDTPRLAGGRKGKGAQVKTLLGGLMTCGCCGAAVVAVNSRYYGCVTRKDRGASVCTGVMTPRDETETRIIGEIRQMLLSPGAIAELHAEVRRLLKAAAKDLGKGRTDALKRLSEIDIEITRVIDTLISIGSSQALSDKLKALELEKARLSKIAEAERTLETAIPDIKDVKGKYREKLMDLQNALKSDVEKARTMLRDILGEIRIYQDGKSVYAEVESDRQLLVNAAGLSPEVVAGAVFVSRRLIKIR